MIDNKVLNEAIFRVLRTQFKKDMIEAYKIVEGAGYAISKWNGKWHIKNIETGKSVWVSGGWNCGYIYSSGRDNIIRYSEGKCKVDFVNLLLKPFNREWYDMRWKEMGGTDYYVKKDKLRGAKWRVKYEQDSIDKIKRDITNLMNRLEQTTRNKTLAEKELEAVRKELGLKA